MKICISIPVHERPDVIVDQINNINHFYGNDVLIVLHKSKFFIEPTNFISNREYDFINKDNVLINPEQLPTSYPNTLVHVHNSNFKFAKQICDFDYFVLHASNDMYIRKGVKEYITEAKNGTFQQELIYEGSPWAWAGIVMKDWELKNIVNHLGISKMYASQPEGVFFQTEIFEEMVKVIDKFYSYGRAEVYPREEVYYPTLISKFTTEMKAPLLYSEVVCNSRIGIDTINKIRDKQLIYNPDDVYDLENIYAVKRVTREFNDPNRVFIRNLMLQNK